eukprot:TRINITY_DN1205_c0_g1_i1.p3 TRINITY_DN1205_c0_g1~~TRINITY_DN1205_c0_g1_i1.p3  ORF type:complete len:120 (+),score=8.13 TRINITY_DN1205_c0_g1_i1:146-505(+)
MELEAKIFGKNKLKNKKIKMRLSTLIRKEQAIKHQLKLGYLSQKKLEQKAQKFKSTIYCFFQYIFHSKHNGDHIHQYRYYICSNETFEVQVPHHKFYRTCSEQKAIKHYLNEYNKSQDL